MKLKYSSWVDVEEYFKENDTVIVGVGSIECHGMHNPLGVDAIIPEYILDRIADRTDILILPTVQFGATDYFLGYPGTISLGGELLYQVLKKITDAMVSYGAKRFIFLNGHGGNNNAIENVCLDLDKQGLIGCCLNWWTMVWDLNPDWKGGHGGGEETAAILAIDESLVNRDRMIDVEFYDISDTIHVTGLRRAEFKGVNFAFPKACHKMTKSGWVGQDHPKDATKEWGEAMLGAFCDYLVEFIEEFKKVKL